ncbi:YitT family protein [Virgibacillus xinjiangensis]|uniref:YitT family protein n=1 Tax=Virgibacillus xinjiangensis TaxID=393090 RepID=A0ABV7CVQ5_9BACI
MFLLKKAGSIMFGSVLLSIGVNFFLTPFRLLDGGLIGVGLIIRYLTGMQTGLVIIGLSIPIFVLAWIYYREYFYNSLHGMLFSSFAIDLLSPFHQQVLHTFHIPPLLSSVLGGLFIGLGVGVMLRWKTSTGGTDLLAQFMAKAFQMNVGVLIFIMDVLIISAGGLLISPHTFLLSFITILFVGVFTSICTWDVKY